MLLAEVRRRRGEGAGLTEALAWARRAAVAPRSSVLATLRAAMPGVGPARLSKASLVAVTRVLEDEIATSAESALLMGCFQRAVFYEVSRPRWTDLAATATATVVLAGGHFTGSGPGPTGGRLIEVALPAGHPLAREWVIVCESSTLSVALAGSERPGSGRRGDSQRLFETVWTLEPQATREAARTVLGAAARLVPEAEVFFRRLDDPTEATPASLRLVTSVSHRIVAAVERAHARRARAGRPRAGRPHAGQPGAGRQEPPPPRSGPPAPDADR